MLTNTTLVYFLEKESYLLSVSQKSNKLKKTNTIVPRSLKDSQRIKRKKKFERIPRGHRVQSLAQSRTSFKDRSGCSELCPIQFWRISKTKSFKTFLGTRSSAFSLSPWKTFLLTSSCYYPCYSLIAPLILSLYIPSRFSRARCPLISALHWFYSPTTEASLSPMNFSKSATELRATEAGPACFLRWLTIPS